MTIAVQRQRLAAVGITPRGLPLAMAAAYVGLSGPTFLAQVTAGIFPAPLPLDTQRRQIWDRAAIDSALARLGDIEHTATATGGADRQLHAQMLAAIEADA